MPRTVPRTIGSEDSLARRIEYERERRGWSPASLAERLTKVGCQMTQSSIWKIENGNPRRRITVDEAVAFAQVFGLKLEDLLVPAEYAQNAEAIEAIGHLLYLMERAQELGREADEDWTRLARLIGKENVQEEILAWYRGERADDSWLARWFAEVRESRKSGGNPVADVLDALDDSQAHTRAGLVKTGLVPEPTDEELVQLRREARNTIETGMSMFGMAVALMQAIRDAVPKETFDSMFSDEEDRKMFEELLSLPRYSEAEASLHERLKTAYWTWGKKASDDWSNNDDGTIGDELPGTIEVVPPDDEAPVEPPASKRARRSKKGGS